MASGSYGPRRPTSPCLSRSEWRHRKNQANRVVRYQGRTEAEAQQAEDRYYESIVAAERNAEDAWWAAQ